MFYFLNGPLNFKQRIYASLLFLGACILLFRTITMVVQGNLRILVLWVSVLLIAELVVDLGCAVFSVVWWIHNDSRKDRIPLRFGAAAALLHAFRVLVFVIGRVGPWIDFDVRPEHRALHDTRWNMGEVFFASTMSIFGIIGVVSIWLYRRKMRKVLPIFFILSFGGLDAQDINAPVDPKVYCYKTIESDSLKAYVYFPADTQKGEKSPAIAIFHGGGWAMGEPSWGFGRARRFAEMGFVAISVQYRISDQESVTPIDAMEDTKDFFLWARNNNTTLGIYKDSIVAYGWSAGGHLIACAAVFPKFTPDTQISSTPDVLLLHSPAVSVINDGWFEQLLLQKGQPIDFSPAENIKGHMPPSIIVIGRDDTVTPLKYSERFQNEMHKHGNICELHVYDGVGHMFTPSSQPDNLWPNPDKEVSKKAFGEIDKFLRSQGYMDSP